ncbi:dihydroorotate dehydrogenase [Halobacillus naozhouensis]|uniref:Dihydroorotate dehydrogenase n=1 Tax=Halobacillus naozhouensis TaxID=554880 RepID=A0ABY8J5S5_9BACI|nr:dihydroorotate dehydrogenase [Halobacillus naozhouensis]WFT76115.1 dihydroorotate dehydrogenase [Halobacillus naozhouensis]
MPDWSYHPLFKPWLTKLPPGISREFIYRSMGCISSIRGGRSFIELLGHLDPPTELNSTVDGVPYASSIGVSARLDPKGTGAKSFSSLGINVIEAGPVSLTSSSAKESIMNKDREEIWFPFPEPTKTVEECRNQIKRFSGPVIVTIDEQMTGEEAHIIINKLSDEADSFSISLEQAFELRTAAIDKNLYIHQIADCLKADQLSSLMSSNQFNGVMIEPTKVWDEEYFTESRDAAKSLVKAVRMIQEKVSQTCTVITKGGIREPIEAHELHQLGVSLLLLEEGYVFTGPGLPKRINELWLSDGFTERDDSGARWGLLFGLAILFAGIIALVFSMTRVILPYDEAFIGMSRDQIAVFNPRILAFMAHDRMALAGTMISGGILYIQLARHGLVYRMRWANRAFHVAAILGFLGIFAFIGYGYFDWLHGVFWLLLLPIYIKCFRLTKRSYAHPGSINRSNHSAWQKANWGQLLFVLLGSLIAIGGVVIMFIGMTHVFVPTDITFLCVTPDMLQSLNERLIPVIAHDRAGFGGALVSVGVLVLLLSLWGFREGESWVWNTLAVGAPPAFVAGLATHFVIGYTSFYHLLPAYLLVVIYVLGLVLSYPYLKRRQSVNL